MGNLFAPSLLLLMKMVSLGAVAMISVKRKLLKDMNTPFSQHLPKNSIFGHFSPFVPAHGQPLDPTSTFIDKTIITGCCCNDIYGKRATPGYYNPIFPPYASNSIFGHFWLFLTIFDHFCLLMGDPMIPPLLLFTKMLPLCILLLIIFHTRPISTRQLNYLEDEGIRAAIIILVG